MWLILFRIGPWNSDPSCLSYWGQGLSGHTHLSSTTKSILPICRSWESLHQFPPTLVQWCVAEKLKILIAWKLCIDFVELVLPYSRWVTGHNFWPCILSFILPEAVWRSQKLELLLSEEISELWSLGLKFLSGMWLIKIFNRNVSILLAFQIF